MGRTCDCGATILTDADGNPFCKTIGCEHWPDEYVLEDRLELVKPNENGYQVRRQRNISTGVNSGLLTSESRDVDLATLAVLPDLPVTDLTNASERDRQTVEEVFA